jgi:hypothetical protein
MGGNLLLLLLVMLWAASLTPLWQKPPGAPGPEEPTLRMESRRGRLITKLGEVLSRLPPATLVSIPDADAAEPPPRRKMTSAAPQALPINDNSRAQSANNLETRPAERQVTAKELLRFIQTEGDALSNAQLRAMSQRIFEVYVSDRDNGLAPEAIKRKAATLTKTLVDSVWGQVDSTIDQLLKSAPDVR